MPPDRLHKPVLMVIRGEREHVVIHSDDSISRIDAATLQRVSEPATPLPCEVTCGVHLGDSIVLCWVDRQHRIARMSAMPRGSWRAGIGRDSLRLALNENRVEDTHPADAIWSHELSAEPLAMASVDGDLVFCTLERGMYRVTARSEEVWRAALPDWPLAWPGAREDIIETMRQVDEIIWVFTDTCGFAAISAEDGTILDIGRLPVTGALSMVRHDARNGWLIVVDDERLLCLDAELRVVSEQALRRPINDAMAVGDGWAWTGWRLDGSTGPDRVAVEHSEIGVALFSRRDAIWALRNDGDWHRHPTPVASLHSSEEE